MTRLFHTQQLKHPLYSALPTKLFKEGFDLHPNFFAILGFPLFPSCVKAYLIVVLNQIGL